jgi:hypothetical protein
VLSFRESILQKIKIDDLAREVLSTLGPPGSGKKVNKKAMQALLKIGGYTHRTERDLELYILADGSDTDAILVLDNELPLYKTTVQDVVMRKSPTVKEMVSIRNAIKILKDTDVVVSRREETVRTVQAACVDRLDFQFEKADIEAIGRDGMAALDNAYGDGVVEILRLFEELLGYEALPSSLTIPHCRMSGAPSRKTSGEVAYGPVVVYNLMYNKLKLVEDVVGVYDKGGIETLQAIASGERDAAIEGSAVFEKLTTAFLESATREDGKYRLHLA